MSAHAISWDELATWLRAELDALAAAVVAARPGTPASVHVSRTDAFPIFGTVSITESADGAAQELVVVSAECIRRGDHIACSTDVSTGPGMILLEGPSGTDVERWHSELRAFPLGDALRCILTELANAPDGAVHG